MMVLGFELGEYLEICKKPLMIFLVLLAINSVLTFVSFELYLYTAAISALFYFGLPLYIGWVAPQRGMGGSRALLAGVIYGLCFGLAQGIVGAFLLTQNPVYTGALDESINEMIANSTAAGKALTRTDVINEFIFSAVIFGPLIFGIIFGIMAFVAGLAAKLLGKEKKAGEDGVAEEAEEEPESAKTKQKPSKRFRRRR